MMWVESCTPAPVRHRSPLNQSLWLFVRLPNPPSSFSHQYPLHHLRECKMKHSTTAAISRVVHLPRNPINPLIPTNREAIFNPDLALSHQILSDTRWPPSWGIGGTLALAKLRMAKSCPKTSSTSSPFSS
jgi:hypothetical protein